MVLRSATLTLIVGTCYTIMHKALQAFVPSRSRSAGMSAVTTGLWIAATLALVYFAGAFLKEVRPQDRVLQCSLVAIMVFTSVVILAKLPVAGALATGIGHRLAFGGASTLNAVALLVFAISLARHLPAGSSILAPLRLLAWGLGLTVLLGLAASGYMVIYLTTGRGIAPLPFLQPLAILSFIFTSAMTLWFLARFRRIDNYAALVHR